MKHVMLGILIISLGLFTMCGKGSVTQKPMTNLVKPAKNIFITPLYKNLVRYQQKSINSCLITSIYMLVHTTKGTHIPINQTHAEFMFDGTRNPSEQMINEDELAASNNLNHKFLKAVSGEKHFLDPQQPDLCMNQLVDLLHEAPFILGVPGHAVLVIGVDKITEELIIVDPQAPFTDMRIKINSLNTAGDIFYSSKN